MAGISQPVKVTITVITASVAIFSVIAIWTESQPSVIFPRKAICRENATAANRDNAAPKSIRKSAVRERQQTPISVINAAKK